MTPQLQLSAPANVLIAGEYAITLEGGRGIAAATAPRATVRIFWPERADRASIAEEISRTGIARLVLNGKMGSRQEAVIGRDSSLLSALADELGLAQENEKSDDHEQLIEIEVDTRSFFDPATGRKRGFGSSAVATLLTAAALRALLGEDPVDDLWKTVTLAISAHRAMHNGRGSGYDVATSALGGVVSFSGGARPSIQRSAIHTLIENEGFEMYTAGSARPVDSSAAVQRFEEFVEIDGRRHYLETNNAIVNKIEGAEGWCDAFRALDNARICSEALGRQIGVSAEFPYCRPHVDDGWIAKASGAGNERAVILARPDHRRPIPSDAQALVVERDGLIWIASDD